MCQPLRALKVTGVAFLQHLSVAYPGANRLGLLGTLPPN
jgi:hypothetical protein